MQTFQGREQNSKPKGKEVAGIFVTESLKSQNLLLPGGHGPSAVSDGI